MTMFWGTQTFLLFYMVPEKGNAPDKGWITDMQEM